MREILFRGKRTDNGEWVYGNYVHTDCYIKHNDYIGQNNPLEYMVNPETVGQYTGLKDKNGNKIFEGDLLKDDSGFIHKVIFDGGCFMRKYKLTSRLMATTSCVMEVIGNIHDNADLLK